MPYGKGTYGTKRGRPPGKKKVKKYASAKHGLPTTPFEVPGMIYDDIKKYLKERKDKKRRIMREKPKKKDLENLRKNKDMIMGGFFRPPANPLGAKSQNPLELPPYKYGTTEIKYGHGGKVGMKKAVSSKRVKAHRGDGIAKRGRTKGRIV